jgi:signal transduction histidine kinase
VANALKHGSPNHPVRVLVTTDERRFELAVVNAGEPIDPAVIRKLFLPFFRGNGRSSNQGLGLGLYIASEIARAHGGQIEVASSADETRFTLHIPEHDSNPPQLSRSFLQLATPRSFNDWAL